MLLERSASINFLIFSDQECFVLPVRGSLGVKLSREQAITTGPRTLLSFVLKHLRYGIPVALEKNRRSGAQRGASENNFGQRFSVSTPCFMSYARD
jgi:hypothetical protein